MTSMRKLRRRLITWERYAGRYGYPSPKALLSLQMEPLTALPLGGHCRAWDAVEIERECRQVRAVYWPTDPYEGYGPCFCLGCIGGGRCEHATADDDPEDDFGCGNWGCRGDCEDCFMAESVADDVEWPPDVITIIPAGGVL